MIASTISGVATIRIAGTHSPTWRPNICSFISLFLSRRHGRLANQVTTARYSAVCCFIFVAQGALRDDKGGKFKWSAYSTEYDNHRRYDAIEEVCYIITFYMNS